MVTSFLEQTAIQRNDNNKMSIIRDYQSGIPLRKIAKKYNMTKGDVITILKKANAWNKGKWGLCFVK